MPHICTHVLGCTTVTNLLGLLSQLRVNWAMFLGHPSRQLRTIKEGHGRPKFRRTKGKLYVFVLSPRIVLTCFNLLCFILKVFFHVLFSLYAKTLGQSGKIIITKGTWIKTSWNPLSQCSVLGPNRYEFITHLEV